MNKRIKKLGGSFKKDSFDKLVRQVEGKGVLLVVIVNTKCSDCQKLQDFINALGEGWIQKLPNLVVCYGYSNASLDDDDENSAQEENLSQDAGTGGDEAAKGQKKLSDSKLFSWETLPQEHGYAILTSPAEVQVYTGGFDHDEFKANIITAVRRCKSPIRTLAGLPGKRQFMEAKRTGIVVETASSTANSEISALEEEVKKSESKLNIKVYFCKGLTTEISLIKAGEIIHRQKGLSFEKFLKKMPRKV